MLLLLLLQMGFGILHQDMDKLGLHSKISSNYCPESWDAAFLIFVCKGNYSVLHHLMLACFISPYG